MATERLAQLTDSVERRFAGSSANQHAIFWFSHAFSTDARNRQSFPIWMPVISPFRAIFCRVLGWIFSIAAASSLLRRFSNDAFIVGKYPKDFGKTCCIATSGNRAQNFDPHQEPQDTMGS